VEGSGHGTDRDTIQEFSLKGPRKIMTKFRQDSWCPGQNSNEALPEYKSEELPLGPTCLVFILLSGLLHIHPTDQHAISIQYVTKIAVL
jgi:hypothetical protein